jgi:hypothetical protein
MQNHILPARFELKTKKAKLNYIIADTQIWIMELGIDGIKNVRSFVRLTANPLCNLLSTRLNDNANKNFYNLKVFFKKKEFDGITLQKFISLMRK